MTGIQAHDRSIVLRTTFGTDAGHNQNVVTCHFVMALFLTMMIHIKLWFYVCLFIFA